MRLRLVVFPVATLAGAATAVLITLPQSATGTSAPSSASFTAVDFSWNAAGGGNTATIAQGGTVSFGYPSGSSQHNADFGTGPHPSSCSQTAGTSSGTVPPLPHNPTAPGWSGTCTFNTPGTYTFHCDLHSFMTATIVVQGAGTTTGTTATTTPPTTTTTPTTTVPTTTVPTTTTTTTTTTPPTTTATATAATTSGPGASSSSSPGTPASLGSTPADSPLASGPRAIAIAAVQHGHAVRGLLRIPAAGTQGRLEVDVLVGGAPLAGRRRHATLRVGRFIKAPLRPGLLRFSVPLSRAAQTMLRRRGRLELTLRITIVAPASGRVRVSRHVLLKV